MMRRLLAVAVLVAACGGKEKAADKPADKAGDKAAPVAEKPAEKTPADLLCRLWAAPENNATSKTLLQFGKDGKYLYLSFDGTAWTEAPSGFSFENGIFTDTGDKQTYKVAVSETELSLDNPEEGKTDFLKWRPAKPSDCDADSTATDCSIKGKKIPFACGS